MMKVLTLCAVLAGIPLAGCHEEICAVAKGGWEGFKVYHKYAQVTEKDQRNLEKAYDGARAYCAFRGITIPPR